MMRLGKWNPKTLFFYSALLSPFTIFVAARNDFGLRPGGGCWLIADIHINVNIISGVWKRLLGKSGLWRMTP